MWKALRLPDKQTARILGATSSKQRVHYWAICQKYLPKLQRRPVAEILGHSRVLRAENGNVDIGRLYKERVRLVKFALNGERTSTLGAYVGTLDRRTTCSNSSNTPIGW